MKAWIVSFALLLFVLLVPKVSYAQVCYSARTIDHFACISGSCSGTDCCLQTAFRCTNNAGQSCTPGGSQCDAYGGGGQCVEMCINWNFSASGTCQYTGSYNTPCSGEAAGCSVTATTCTNPAGPGECAEGTSTFGCWGPGGTPTPTPTPGVNCGNGTCGSGETCGNCSADCGACPTPTSPPPLCPNGACDIAESCSSCPADCGACINGTVQARAVIVDPADTSCTAVNASTNYLNGTQLRITGESQQTQGGGNYVQWTPVNAGGYTLTATFPGDYGLAAGCWNRTVTSPTSGTGMGSSFSANGETLTWNVGAVPPGPWVQTRGGEVYTAANVQSLLPSTAVPSRNFILTGTGGYPGVLRYGGNYDLEIDVGAGESYISATNWNANTTDRYTTDYYDLFWRKFGGPTTPDYDLEALSSPIPKPGSRETPYFTAGNMETLGNWVVGDGEHIIFLIPGDLTIRGTITTVGTGFIAFIVDRNITIDSSVGTTFNSTTPVLEGVYITSPNGTFQTGNSSVAGAERFVGQGVFVAGSFVLQRDLASVGQNGNRAAEYFVYDPSILVTMPEEMKEAAVTWSEVAP